MIAYMLVLQEGLTFAEVVRDIPHDAAAMLVYALIATFVFLIWRGSRQRSN